MTTKRLSDPYGDYAVTSDGKVISYKRNEDGEEVAQKTDKDGYPQVNLSNNEEAHGFKVFRVHDLVARAFLGPRPEGAEVLHKDAKRDNCAASNLKYGSRSENATQREADKRADSVFDDFIRLDSNSQFSIGKWEQTPEGYLRATAVAALESILDYPHEGRQEFVSEEALKSGAESLLHKPVTLEHPPGGVVDQSNWKKYAVGMVVESRYDSDLRAIVAGVVVTDREAIDTILRKDIREVSPGYRASVVPDSTYGYRQVKRFSNHLAITRAGRGGPEASIRLDSKGPAQEASMTEEEKKALQDKLDAMEKERDEYKSKLDAMAAKADAFEKLAKEKKQEEEADKQDSQFVAKFNERVEALELAKRLDAKVTDTMTNDELKLAVVAAKFSDLRTDSMDAAQIQGVYEAVRVSTPQRNSPQHVSEAWRSNFQAQGEQREDSDDLFAAYNDPDFGQFNFHQE